MMHIFGKFRAILVVAVLLQVIAPALSAYVRTTHTNDELLCDSAGTITDEARTAVLAFRLLTGESDPAENCEQHCASFTLLSHDMLVSSDRVLLIKLEKASPFFYDSALRHTNTLPLGLRAPPFSG